MLNSEILDAQNNLQLLNSVNVKLECILYHPKNISLEYNPTKERSFKYVRVVCNISRHSALQTGAIDYFLKL